MKVYCSKRILLGLSLLLSIHLLMPPLQVLAQDNPSAQPDQTVEPTSPAEIESHLAGMSDEQIRQAYAQKLKNKIIPLQTELVDRTLQLFKSKRLICMMI